MVAYTICICAFHFAFCTKFSQAGNQLAKHCNYTSKRTAIVTMWLISQTTVTYVAAHPNHK